MPFALIFDVDGVIADTEPLSMRASSRAFHDLHGITVTEAEHLPYVGMTTWKQTEGIAAKHGLAIDTGELVAAQRENFLRGLEDAEDIVFPGVLEIFAGISKYSEWRVALATSSGRKRSEATIRAAGIDAGGLSAWITGDDVQHPKPDPEIYLRVASELQLFPTQCVVIEDSIAGVEAAKAASMHCVAVTNSFSGEHLRMADRIVDSLEDVSITMLYDLVTDPAS
ncbi:MAG: HAD family phosphatase [Candidatus Hydrogenedentes bacterium]|nr:HAD family phosphatase [Candidatus Hydrogenedentota bacterium]